MEVGAATRPLWAGFQVLTYLLTYAPSDATGTKTAVPAFNPSLVRRAPHAVACDSLASACAWAAARACVYDPDNLSSAPYCTPYTVHGWSVGTAAIGYDAACD